MFRAFQRMVEDALTSALEARDLPTTELGLEEPPEEFDAVLASSLAFRLASDIDAAPAEIATDITAAIDPAEYEYIESVQTAGPYINFLPSEVYFHDTLIAGREGTYGQLPPRNETVIVEHTSANPTGPIHVGRARNPILGDAIARLLDYAGYDVTRHYYVNDAGRQIAVFTWAFERFDEDELPEPERTRIEYDLVRYYRQGSSFLETADPDAVETAEAEIHAIMQGLEDGDEETYDRVTTVVDQVLPGMRECLLRLPADFDAFIKETRFIKSGRVQNVISRLQSLDEAGTDDGAWVLDLADYGIENPFVFVRSDGTSLYATRDIAHHEWKLEQADYAITVLGEDHKLQADQLRTTLELLGHDVSPLDQVFYSWVNLPEGGMSTRKGTGINLDDLLDEAVQRARHEVESRIDSRGRGDELGPADIERIANQVGIGAVRYDIVSKQPTKGITFRWEDALDFDAQSAPYIQYVHARCCGILDNASPPSDVDPSALTEAEERSLLRVIARFPAVVETAAADREPHVVASYTRELAESFNAFYRECPVLTAPDPTRGARLALVQGTRHTVANALDILGIDAPESM